MNKESLVIIYTCELCKTEYTINPGLVNIRCMVPSCKGKTVIFNRDIRRKLHETNSWEICKAGKSYSATQLVGTVGLGIYDVEIYEIKKEEKEPKKEPTPDNSQTSSEEEIPKKTEEIETKKKEVLVGPSKKDEEKEKESKNSGRLVRNIKKKN